MLRSSVLAAALFMLAGLSPTSAQWSFGVGVEYGAPVYGPPPVYAYEEPPVLYAPAQPIPSAVPPDVVFDMLERAGYREFSPMAFRDGVYKLNAVNRRGDLVALEVSALTGAVEIEYLIAARRAAISPAQPPPPARVPQAPARQQGDDPLVVY